MSGKKLFSDSPGSTVQTGYAVDLNQFIDVLGMPITNR